MSTEDPIVLAEAIYQGEGKWLRFIFTVNSLVVPTLLDNATFAFNVKADLDAVESLYTADLIDTDEIAQGIVRVNLPASATSLLEPGSYFGELESVIEEDVEVDKKLIKFKIKKAVTP